MSSAATLSAFGLDADSTNIIKSEFVINIFPLVCVRVYNVTNNFACKLISDYLHYKDFSTEKFETLEILDGEGLVAFFVLIIFLMTTMLK